MSVMLLFAGATGPRVKLADCMRDLHALAKERRQKEIDERKAKGIPLDDDIRWDDAENTVNDAARYVARQDSPALREAAQRMIEMTAGALAPVGDLEIPDGAEEIELQFRVLSDADRRELAGKEAAAWSEVKKARDTKDQHAMTEAVAHVVDCRSEYVENTVAGIFGIEGKTGIDAELIDALRRTGLLAPIYEAASHFQDLPAKKALQFGVQPASTSPSSNAESAPSFAESDLVAMAARESLTVAGLTSRAQSMKLTHAPEDTSSITLT